MDITAVAERSRARAGVTRPGRPGPWWIGAWLCLAAGISLRAWGIGSHDLTFDEAFTGTAARRPVADLFDFLRTSDTHPPLDYLIRAPFTAADSDLALRLPSVTWSVGTLLLLAWWMRAKGPFGALVVIVASLAPFLVLHGREARVYSLVMFLGVVAGLCSERWLDVPRRRYVFGVAAASALALFAHSAALAPVGLLLFVPGLRRDQAAWTFRAAVGAALLAWAVSWGPAFIDQATGIRSFWIPLSTPDWVEVVAAATVSPVAALVHVSAVLLGFGAVLLVVRHGRTGVVALPAFIVPFLVLAVLGAEIHVMLPRSFAFGAWVAAAALAAVVEEVRQRLGSPAALLPLAAVAMLLVPSSLEIVREPRERHVALDELRRRLEPGDRIAIGPTYFRPVIEWEFGGHDRFEPAGTTSGRFVMVDPSARPSGRTHVLDHSRLPVAEGLVEGATRCAPDLETSSWLLRCISSDSPS